MSHLPRRSKWRWILPCLLTLYWAALFVATHLPRNVPYLPSERTDKPIHFVAYFALAALLAATWQHMVERLQWRHFWWAWLTLVLYAAVDESTQTLVGRTASFRDWFADVLGATCGLAIFALVSLYLWRRKATSGPDTRHLTPDT
jgi:VanZ family protein